MKWQLIETAPKDGSRILAWREDWKYPEFVRWHYNTRTNSAFWNDAVEYDEYDLERHPPKYWFDIPPVPAAPNKNTP